MAPKDSDKALAKTSKGGVEKAAKKTAKKAKDPNAPKRPMSAYFFFSNEVREKVKADNPGIAFGEVGKKIGEMWAKLSADEKGPYEKKAEADKARYEKEKASYQKA